MMPFELVVPYWWSRLKYGVVLYKAVTEKIFACTGKTLRTSALATETYGKYGCCAAKSLPGGWGVAFGEYVASRSAILALPLSLSPVPKSVGSEVNLQQEVLLSRSTQWEILFLTISNRSVYCVKTRQFVSSPMPNIRQSVFAIIHIST